MLNGRQDELADRRLSEASHRDETAGSVAYVDDVIDLSAFHRPYVNVTVLRRREHLALAAYATKLARSVPVDHAGIATFGQPSGLDAIDALAGLLPPDDARDALIEDLAFWIEVMTELSGATNVSIRLTRLARSVCPAFQIDRSSVRLVCTYAGAPSEWLEESHVDRSMLGPGPHSSENAIRRGAIVRRCSPLDVVFFKGAAWPDNARRGAVHRSPPTVAPRLLLVIEPWGSSGRTPSPPLHQAV